MQAQKLASNENVQFQRVARRIRPCLICNTPTPRTRLKHKPIIFSIIASRALPQPVLAPPPPPVSAQSPYTAAKPPVPRWTHPPAGSFPPPRSTSDPPPARCHSACVQNPTFPQLSAYNESPPAAP